MKARLNLDQFADMTTMTPEQRKLMKWSPKKVRDRTVPEAYFPKGTIFEGDQALALCKTGQASPADEECATALGWPEDRIKAQQVEYEMNALGLDDDDDRTLYRAGVIKGVGPNKEYIHGENWDAYHAGLKQAEETEEV